MSRHSWGEPVRFERKTERECRNGCGVVKVTRHEGGRHWLEYWRPDERREDGWSIESRAPACEPARVAA